MSKKHKKSSLDPMDVAQFSIAQNQARQGYGETLATNTYNINQAREGLLRNLQGLDLSGTQQRNQLPGQFAHRGTLNSGIYKDALANWAANQTYQRGNYNYQAQTQIGGYDLANQQAALRMKQALSDIALQKQARRAQIAAQLRGLK